MKNSAYIKLISEADSLYQDIYEVYGVSFLRGSYIKLISPPKMKSYITNNDRLKNGVQYLTAPSLMRTNESTLSLDILFEAPSFTKLIDRIEAFSKKLSSDAFYLKIPSYNRIFSLVYNSLEPKTKYNGNYATFTLSITEPNVDNRKKITE